MLLLFYADLLICVRIAIVHTPQNRANDFLLACSFMLLMLSKLNLYFAPIILFSLLKFSECPDGLLCTSTIPSHYKRYTHLQLAQSRSSNSPFSSPSHGSAGSFSKTNSGLLCNLEERWFPYEKQTENLKNVSADHLLVTQCLRKSRSPTETSKKISSSTNIQTSQQAPQFAQCVKNDKWVGVGLPLAEELDSQNNSENTNLLLPKNDFSDCEISYSPLQSDEETYSIDEKLDDSQQELFFIDSSKDGSLEDDSSCTWLKKFHGPLLTDQEDGCLEVNTFLTQDKYNEELYKYKTLNDSSQLIFQNENFILCHAPACDDDFLLFPPALAGGLAFSSSQATTAKPDEPELRSSHSNKQKQVIEESAVYNQISLPLLKSEMPKPSQSQREGCLSSHQTQSKIREFSCKNFSAKNSTNSACFCRKTVGDMVDSRVTVLNTEEFPSTPIAAKSLKILPSGPKCNATQPPTKVMKQTDIGVYFGLPPKIKEDKLMGERALEGMNLNPVVSPNEKRSRRCKRKAEKSLSDLEFDAENLNENWQSVEGSGKRSWHRRKRLKKSDSLPEGTLQKRSDHLIDKTEAGTVNVSKEKVFTKSAFGTQQRGNAKIPDSSNAGELRKRTCPFYKKIPGKLKYQCLI